MLRGLANVSFFAADLEEAGRWYTELLGFEPYFSVPGYLEFRIGDYAHELGIIDARYAPPGPGEPGGAIAYWHVDDVRSTLDRLTELGASVREPIRERGHGFVTASVVDPFGNVLGVMQNPHYLEILERDQA
ncbi:VOC family protein [Naasia aerilata]|uniref:Glyoxalase n=1 Tax=Naasia aerilata TaxID=1162966 RepID=A0ABN6XT73_9MICO|nr:VOC family protein [Naasia aerilata]BDZ46865.1 glyoxalase [Naasia aerilata]